MLQLKSEKEIAKILAASQILAEILQACGDLVEPGITTGELDDFIRNSITRRGAKPAFLGYLNYPASLCISINNEVIHGIPGRRKLQEGDIAGLDVGIEFDGYFSDTAITIGVGRISTERERLLKVTEQCLEKAIEQATAGNRVSDISRAVYDHARANNYDVVRQYCGHGVGFSQHEDPQVPNYLSTGPNPRLRPGMVIAIEPMINQGGWQIEVLEDDWTVVTADGLDSAHFEHTIAIFKDRTEVLTSFKS